MRLTPYKNNPTMDIYFFQPMKGLISNWRGKTPGRPIRRLGANSFVCNNRAVIIRYATNAELEIIRKLKVKSCAYVIDDDLAAIAQDRSLPEDYRQRLSAFKNTVLPDILHLSDTIVAPNTLIHKAYGDKSRLFLNPSYTSLCRDFSHFDDSGQLRMVFCGTRSHLNDLEFIADAILEICEDYKHVSFTTFLSKHAPDSLQNRQNIIHRNPETWKKFKSIQKKERFHIALAPYKNTPFNRARSINKMLDHAAFGAAGLYSDMPPLSSHIQHNQTGLLIEENTDTWREAIKNVIKNSAQARHLAQAGAKQARSLGNPARVRAFWRKYLGIE